MPRATLNVAETTKYNLKTLDGAYVTLRRMTYGDILQRRAMQMKMTMAFDNKQGAEAQMQLDDGTVTAFEFSKCVVDHNLEHENGQPINLSDPKQFAMLDPKVGQEVEALIEAENNYDGPVEQDFSQPSEASSSADGSQPETMPTSSLPST